MDKLISECKSFSSIHLRAIANDLSSDIFSLSFFKKSIILKDEPFSDDDQSELIDDDSDLLETGNEEVIFKSMNSSEINDAVKDVNQKIIQTSKKVTNIHNPIKVLVRKYKTKVLQYIQVSKQKRRFKLDGFNLDLTCNIL